MVGDKEEVKTDPETGQRYIVIDVRCVTCKLPVSPSEVELELFRNAGIPCHNTEPCLTTLMERLRELL